MDDLELPLAERTKWYRFFEMLPALLSYGMILLLVVLSIVSPIAASVYLLLVIITMLVKAVTIAIHTTVGYKHLEKAQSINWSRRLRDLENPQDTILELPEEASEYGYDVHKENLKRMANLTSDSYPKPSQMYNAIIIPASTETYELIEPTIQSIISTTYDNNRIIIVLGYEERCGIAIKKAAQRLQSKFGAQFKAFEIVMHPDGLPDELLGKGSNITYAGYYLKQWLRKNKISYSNVIVTTLDSDNKPHKHYFDYVTYEYIVHQDREHLSFQPIALFLNNIWDAPAPMRVIATGNSFWNIISSMRPHTLRNFASHSQPMSALVAMNFWSKRSIVEDGHQYWRSYFFFKGNYGVIPIYVPIYQDAVLADTYPKTLRAQFVQLRRWAYGASDVPYVATRVFSLHRSVPFWPSLARLLRLIDGHVTLACIPILVAFGGWVPLLVNNQASLNIVAHQLPEVVSGIHRIALLGLVITVFLAFKMLPPRPERYKRRRSVWMVLQWILMPLTAIMYTAASAFNAQTRLLFGRYLTKFDITEKKTTRSSR